MQWLIIRHGNVSDDQRAFTIWIADSFIMHYSPLSALLLWSLGALHLLRLLFFHKLILWLVIKKFISRVTKQILEKSIFDHVEFWHGIYMEIINRIFSGLLYNLLHFLYKSQLDRLQGVNNFKAIIPDSLKLS